MEKSKSYYFTRFPLETIREVYQKFLELNSSNTQNFLYLEVFLPDESWKFDSIEEFFSNFNNAVRFDFDVRFDKEQNEISIIGEKLYTHVTVKFQNRNKIESIFEILERDINKSKIVITKDPISIFIGHGGNEQWRLLKEHLQDYHGFKVVTYEISPRAGKSINEVLQEMVDSSSIAFLVLTGEDQKNYGELHARQNVVHELGLFQGKLGFEKAIILLEEGVSEFSNISGLTQIRFPKNSIRETYGDVLAVIKREFSD